MPDRALAIIAACGADPARWPAGERGGVAALAATPAIAAALAGARDLDGMLDAWAVDVAPHDFDALALARAAGGKPSRWHGWLAGAVMAAAVVTGFAVLTPSGPAVAPGIAPTTAGSPAASGAPPTAPPSDADREAFAMLFTPTADEDELI